MVAATSSLTSTVLSLSEKVSPMDSKASIQLGDNSSPGKNRLSVHAPLSVPLQTTAGSGFAKIADIIFPQNTGDNPEKSGHVVHYVDYKDPITGHTYKGFYKENKHNNPTYSILESGLTASHIALAPSCSPGLVKLVTNEENNVLGIFIGAIPNFTELKKVRDHSEPDAVLKRLNSTAQPPLLPTWQKSNLIERIALIKQQVKSISYDEAYQETLKQLARILILALFLEEDDLHLNNIGLDSNGDLKRIDFDMCMYHSIISLMPDGERIYPRFNSGNRFVLTPPDLEYFPNLKKANPHYWVTYFRFMTNPKPLVADKGYTVDDTTAFSALSTDPIFKREAFTAMIELLNHPKQYFYDIINNSIPDSEPRLKQRLVRALTLRQSQFRAVTLSVLMKRYNRSLYGIDIQSVPHYQQLSQNDTPLTVAIKVDYQAASSITHFMEDINTLVDGKTPLEIAAEVGNDTAVRELLELRVKTVKDKHTKLPRALAVAIKNGHYHTAKLLCQDGAITRSCSRKAILRLVNDCVNKKQYDLALILLSLNKTHHHIKRRYAINRKIREINPDTEKFLRALYGDKESNRIRTIIAQFCEEIDSSGSNPATLAHLYRYRLDGFKPSFKTSSGVFIHDLVRHHKQPEKEIILPCELNPEEFCTIMEACEPLMKKKATPIRLKLPATSNEFVATHIKSLITHLIEHKPHLYKTVTMLRQTVNSDKQADILLESLADFSALQSSLSLIQVKRLTRDVLKSITPSVKSFAELSRLVKILEGEEFDYLREYRHRGFICRRLFGTHGLTHTYKEIYKQIYKQAEVLKKQCKKNQQELPADGKQLLKHNHHFHYHPVFAATASQNKRRSARVFPEKVTELQHFAVRRHSL